MNIESKSPYLPENQPETVPFRITNTKNYSIGISQDRSDIKPGDMIKLIEKIQGSDPDALSGYRDKNKVVFALSDGLVISVMVKAKFSEMANAFDSHSTNQVWRQDYENYEEYKKKLNSMGIEDFENSPFSRENLKKTYQEARLADS
ncbi:MAG: hypothetical protein CEN91_104, partial [Candidatus Berkelbacteria bacterium Licking1014_85]